MEGIEIEKLEEYTFYNPKGEEIIVTFDITNKKFIYDEFPCAIGRDGNLVFDTSPFTKYLDNQIEDYIKIQYKKKLAIKQINEVIKEHENNNTKLYFYNDKGEEIEQFKNEDGTITLKEMPSKIGSNNPKAIKDINYGGHSMKNNGFFDQILDNYYEEKQKEIEQNKSLLTKLTELFCINEDKLKYKTASNVTFDEYVTGGLTFYNEECQEIKPVKMFGDRYDLKEVPIAVGDKNKLQFLSFGRFINKKVMTTIAYEHSQKHNFNMFTTSTIASVNK